MARVSRLAYDPRCCRLPPHKPLPSREALVLWIGLQPLWQVADIWPLRPADNRPNPCGTQFPHPKTRAAILRQAEPFDCHPKTAHQIISMRRSDKKSYHQKERVPHKDPDRVVPSSDVGVKPRQPGVLELSGISFVSLWDQHVSPLQRPSASGDELMMPASLPSRSTGM